MLRFRDEIATGISTSQWCGSAAGPGCAVGIAGNTDDDDDDDGYPWLSDCDDLAAYINPGVGYSSIDASGVEEDCNCVDRVGFSSPVAGECL
jgi:hypothetical protein